jgi:hypothetical protein
MGFGEAVSLLNRPVRPTLRAVPTPTLTKYLVVVFKDLLPALALAPIVIDLNGILAVAQRIDA